MRRPVRAVHEVISNVDRYVGHMQCGAPWRPMEERASSVRTWIAYRGKDGKWRFAPAEFVAFHGMSLADYAEDVEKGGSAFDRREIDKALRNISARTPWQMRRELRQALTEFLVQLDAAPHRFARIRLLHGGVRTDDLRDPDTILAESLLTLYRSYPEEAQREFRRLFQSEIS